MCKKRGFTLVEMLFVVLIAAGVLVFAVPAYKRVQEKANYDAALGTLLDVSNAVNSLERDLRMVSSENILFPRETGTMWSFSNTLNNTGTFSTSAVAWNQELADSYNSADDWDTQFWGALFSFGYLKPIQQTKGYNMYIINGQVPQAIGNCQAEDGTVVACMLDATKKGCYKGARVLSDGSVQRIKGSLCTD